MVQVVNREKSTIRKGQNKWGQGRRSENGAAEDLLRREGGRWAAEGKTEKITGHARRGWNGFCFVTGTGF